jgi:hypothetical protein
MMELQQETTVAKVRLHWGIFIPVLLFALFPMLVSVPLIFLFHGLFKALGQTGTTPFHALSDMVLRNGVSVFLLSL